MEMDLAYGMGIYSPWHWPLGWSLQLWELNFLGDRTDCIDFWFIHLFLSVNWLWGYKENEFGDIVYVICMNILACVVLL